MCRDRHSADPPRPALGGPADPLACRYLADEPSGTSAKFNCVLDGGEIVKVKYGRNSEIHAEAAATRLLRVAGLSRPTKSSIVPRVRCYGCPRFPFLTTQLLAMARMPTLLGPHGYDDVVHRLRVAGGRTPVRRAGDRNADNRGVGVVRAQVARTRRAATSTRLRLLAVFLAHWDNKSENQRLVCLDDVPAQPNSPASQPLLMIQDLGATFGPTKVNIAAWRDMPVWADRHACTCR